MLAATFNNMLERLEQAFLIQKNFVSNASHELRTPLTSIIGQIDVALLNPRTTDEYSSTLMSIREDLSTFVELSNKLLLLAQTDSKVPTFSVVNMRIDELLWQARQEVIKKNQNFTVHISFENPLVDEQMLEFKGSEQLIKAAFTNLLENGCKYSGNRTCSVQIDITEQHIVLRFLNQAEHFSEEEKEMIFNPFFRASNSIGIQGHGIGLSLVKNIISIHNGTLEMFFADHATVCFKITFFVKLAPGSRIIH